MEQKERIEQLKAEVQRLGGHQAVTWGVDQLPPDVAEELLQRVIDVEKSDGDQGGDTEN